MWDQLTACLEGRLVVLEPLHARHEEGLFAAAQHSRSGVRYLI